MATPPEVFVRTLLLLLEFVLSNGKNPNCESRGADRRGMSANEYEHPQISQIAQMKHSFSFHLRDL